MTKIGAFVVTAGAMGLAGCILATEPTAGILLINTSTSGVPAAGNGSYQVSVGWPSGQRMRETLGNLPMQFDVELNGTHEAEVDEVGGRLVTLSTPLGCLVTGGSSVEIEVIAGETVSIHFMVTCS